MSCSLEDQIISSYSAATYVDVDIGESIIYENAILNVDIDIFKKGVSVRQLTIDYDKSKILIYDGFNLIGYNLVIDTSKFGEGKILHDHHLSPAD